MMANSLFVARVSSVCRGIPQEQVHFATESVGHRWLATDKMRRLLLSL
jgi:hypothetical protein